MASAGRSPCSRTAPWSCRSPPAASAPRGAAAGLAASCSPSRCRIRAGSEASELARRTRYGPNPSHRTWPLHRLDAGRVDGDPSAPLVANNLNSQSPPPGQCVRELTLGAERQRIDRALDAGDERSGHRGNPPFRLGVRARFCEPDGSEQARQLGDRVFLYVEAGRLAVEVTRDVMRTVQAVGGDTHVAATRDRKSVV